MKSLSFLADENIHEFVVKWLQSKGYLATSIRNENLISSSDEVILKKGLTERKIILTQDADFGKIIYTQNPDFYSVIYLRPGHHNGQFHVITLEKILQYKDKIKERSIIIGTRTNDRIRIRIRFIDP